MNYENYIYQQPIDPTRQAILLAMTQSMEQEKEMIRELQGMGVKCVATMAAGFNFDISPKLINNLVGACLNANIIEKKKAHIHPVVHALHEAMDAASACVFIVINAVTGQFTLPAGGAAMGYAFGAAVITSLSFLLLNIGIAGAGAAQASFATLIEPVASVICGVIVLNEKVTLFTIIGIVLILLSVWVNSMHTHEKAPAREKAPAK